jgi:hypothetical protein
VAKFEAATGEDTQNEIVTRSNVRDADQLAIDAIVKPLVDAWKATGEPAPDRLVKGMIFRMKVTKTDRSDIKKGVRRAMNLYGADPMWWKDTKPTADGNLVVKFGPQKRKVKAAETPAPAPDPAPVPAPPADEKRGGLLGTRR